MQLPQAVWSWAAVREPGSGQRPPAHGCQRDGTCSPQMQASGAGKTPLHWDPLSTACLCSAGEGEEREALPRAGPSGADVPGSGPGSSEPRSSHERRLSSPCSAALGSPSAAPAREGEEPSSVFLSLSPCQALYSAEGPSWGLPAEDSAADLCSHTDPRGTFTSGK